MEYLDTPEGYRIKVTESLFGARVKLQKKFWFFWKTIDSCIPIGDDRSLWEDIRIGANLLLASEAARRTRREEWKEFYEQRA